MADGVVPTPPDLILFSSGLLSKFGFGDGDPFEAITEWYHDQHGEGLMRHCDCPSFDLGVSDDDLLRLLVRRYLVPALDQRVELVDIETSHNPVRASRVDGVDVEECWYGRQPEPTLTPEDVEISYADVLRAVEELRAAAEPPAEGGTSSASDLPGVDHA